MTDQERFQILALARCRFGKRGFDQRFARDLASQIRRRVAHGLSPVQRYTLAKMVYRYRRQLAKRLPDELILQQPPVKGDYGLTEEPVLVPDLFTGELSTPHEGNPNA